MEPDDKVGFEPEDTGDFIVATFDDP